MNESAAKAVPTGNEYEAHYRPVWAASFRVVKTSGRVAKFSTELAAEVAAWRVLYSVEQRVMRRDGALVFAAKATADAHFNLAPSVKDKGSNKRTIVERKPSKGKEISVERVTA
ncbi:hypothetical protein DXM27_05225 [Rhizobium rhizogenes]|uniref:Uncharacterized protein n=1 Tax=Rhizobium rhizogenes TaxID=359 RepID=A0AA88F4K0_RHIRH|nr:hypothetical protein [Rhizobium rhizogenes]KAA3504615.1 hypothetical protein DXM27_05225 [Rhizobium rhizogenes]